REALGRFVDLTFASLFAGLAGAVCRLYATDAESAERQRLYSYFLWAMVLFRRFELGERNRITFASYFMHPDTTERVAKELGHPIAVEEGHVFRFLEDLGAFVATEGPRVESEVKVDRAELTDQSRPWARTLLDRELLGAHAAKRRLPS